MSASTGPNDTDPPPNQDAAPSNAERAALQADLEERLAAARVERAKVLAAKGPARKKPSAKRPVFRPDPPGAEGFAQVHAALNASEVMPKVPMDAVNPSQAIAPEPAMIAETQGSQVKRGLYVPQTALIAFACFFGLGFGVILSLGVVVGLGWVSVSDWRGSTGTATPQVAETSPAISQVAPIALDVSASEVVPAPAEIASTVSKPEVVSVSSAPALRIAEGRDAALNAVMSPGPQVDATSAVISFTPSPRAAPIAIPVAFSPLQRESTDAAVLADPQQRQDVPPALPDRSTIVAPQVSVSLQVPEAEAAPVNFPGWSGKKPQTQFAKALFDAGSDVGPAVPEQALPKPGVDFLVLASLASYDYEVPTPSKLGSLALAPRIGPRGTALVLPEKAHSLPAVGGPVVRPKTLAAQLGAAGEDIERIALFTYAPSSVTKDVLNEKLSDLKTTGFPLAETSRVNFKVSKTHIRYYTTADETVARAIAETVGGTARDFTREKITSPSGRIEIWMAGTRVGAPPRAKPRVSTAQRRQAVQAQQQARARTQLKSRLVDSLKRKEYLR